MEEREIPVLQAAHEGLAPHALVLAGVPLRPLTPAEAKKARFVQNLRENHRRLKEALASIERFAVVCELSPERIAAIRKAGDEALDDLSRKFEEKIRAYDARIGKVSS
jgi:transposase